MKFYQKGRHKKLIGLLAILVGLVALVTPFTPGAGFFIFIGLQLMGFNFVFWDKMFHKNSKSS